jgi:hypothetical protein
MMQSLRDCRNRFTQAGFSTSRITHHASFSARAHSSFVTRLPRHSAATAGHSSFVP